MTLSFSDNVLGAINVTGYTTTAPGNAGLPSTTLEPQLGEIRKAWDTTLGAIEVIYLEVPTSTAITANLLYTFNAGFKVSVLPVLATCKNTQAPVTVALADLSSDANNVNYGWFQIQGQATVLKTAVTVAPNVVVYASGTAGRIKVLTSAGGQITGMRTFNATTVTSTTSTVACFLNRPMLQGQIT
jgi:hypothetical protein